MSQPSSSFPRPRRARRRAGFTLIEILIVIALIAGLIGIVVVNFGGMLESGRIDTAKTFVNASLKAPLTQYRLHLGNYPSTAEGLAALSAAPAGREARWRGPYVERLADDPWGNPYQYRFPGTRNPQGFDLWSLGPDGVESADDIGNWNP